MDEIQNYVSWNNRSEENFLECSLCNEKLETYCKLKFYNNSYILFTCYFYKLFYNYFNYYMFLLINQINMLYWSLL